MGNTGIRLDKAELLSVLMEALLYGFSLLMYGGTIWTLLFRRATQRVNRKMFTVACSLLLFSTVHIVIDFIRIMEGLVLYRDTFPGGPIGYFSDVSQWTFVAKNYVYTAQTLIGDGVVLYRCYAVWQSKLIMTLPVLLWCAVAAAGIGSPYTASKVTQDEVFGGSLSQWITSFYASTLATNLVATILLASRIWYIDHKSRRLVGHRKSRLRPILHVIIDAGAIYSVTLLAALVCFVNKSNGQYVILDMVTPIISITFYMVIIRVGLATRDTDTPVPLRNVTTEHSSSAERRRRMRVHITTLTESKLETVEHSLTSPIDSKNRPTESGFDGLGEAV